MIALGLRVVLLVVAVVCFLLVAFGVTSDRVSIGHIGAACFAGSFLVA